MKYIKNETYIEKLYTVFLQILIFKLQVLKLTDIYVNWSSPKIDPKASFSSLENRSFENNSFSQYELFK